MGRIYTATASGFSSAAALDLFEIAAPSTDIVVVHEIGVSQLADVGDAAEEMLLLQWKLGVTTGTATALNANPILVGDSADASTLKYNSTVASTSGNVMYSWYWNIRVPFQHIWTPETRPVLAPSQVAALYQATTPADSITYGIYIVFEEIG